MMTNEQYLLGKLAEEAAELAQIAIKAQQFGLEEVFGGQTGTPLSNAHRIQAEFNDVLGVIKMLNEEELAGIEQIPEDWDNKARKVARWRKYATELGLTEDVTPY